MNIKELIGDYQTFFSDIILQLKEKNVDITPYPLSHLGFRAADFEEYEKLRDQIKEFCVLYHESDHNGRPISIMLLSEPLDLLGGFTVDVLELIPPKPEYSYPSGLEHVGVVIGERVEEFGKKYEDVLTERKVHGPYCKPFYLTFDNGKRVKFYLYSLKNVVEKEGNTFVSL